MGFPGYQGTKGKRVQRSQAVEISYAEGSRESERVNYAASRFNNLFGELNSTMWLWSLVLGSYWTDNRNGTTQSEIHPTPAPNSYVLMFLCSYVLIFVRTIGAE